MTWVMDAIDAHIECWFLQVLQLDARTLRLEARDTMTSSSWPKKMNSETLDSKIVQLFLKVVIPAGIAGIQDPWMAQLAVHGTGYQLPGGYYALFGFSC
jgi:hypothetical protein